jgi:hypothetical protein
MSKRVERYLIITEMMVSIESLCALLGVLFYKGRFHFYIPAGDRMSIVQKHKEWEDE